MVDFINWMSGYMEVVAIEIVGVILGGVIVYLAYPWIDEFMELRKAKIQARRMAKKGGL